MDGVVLTVTELAQCTKACLSFSLLVKFLRAPDLRLAVTGALGVYPGTHKL